MHDSENTEGDTAGADRIRMIVILYRLHADK